LQYTIFNTGDYDIQNVTVTAPCCSFVKLLHNADDAIVLSILESKQYLNVIPVAGMHPGDEIILRFDAYGTMGHHDVDILTVPLN
jgi:hypothetical protein